MAVTDQAVACSPVLTLVVDHAAFVWRPTTPPKATVMVPGPVRSVIQTTYQVEHAKYPLSPWAARLLLPSKRDYRPVAIGHRELSELA